MIIFFKYKQIKGSKNKKWKRFIEEDLNLF